MEGGRVNQSWSMDVAGIEMLVDEHAGLSQDGLVACWEMPEYPKCEVKTLMTTDQTAFQLLSYVCGRAGRS